MKIRKTACHTCIYRPDSPLDLAKLEREVKDRYGCFVGYRLCHHHLNDDDGVVCRGFFAKHGMKVTKIRLAKILGILRFTNE